MADAIAIPAHILNGNGGAAAIDHAHKPWQWAGFGGLSAEGKKSAECWVLSAERKRSAEGGGLRGEGLVKIVGGGRC